VWSRGSTSLTGADAALNPFVEGERIMNAITQMITQQIAGT
jgi:hypothetical protein